MNVKVLFNSVGLQDDLSVGWGLSLLIDHKVLFDTGEKGDLLMSNINKLRIDLSSLESVVISHDHYDHTGGLWDILAKNPQIKIYSCPRFGADFKSKTAGFSQKLIEASQFTIVAAGIYSTGEVVGKYKGKEMSEQALIIKTKKGISVITGCAHPGIIEMLERIKRQLTVTEFYAVLGGFHLKDQSNKEIELIVKKFTELKVRNVGVTHCSGTQAENMFQEVYKDHFLSMKVGDSLTI